jgi:hypothetical protein
MDIFMASIHMNTDTRTNIVMMVNMGTRKNITTTTTMNIITRTSIIMMKNTRIYTNITIIMNIVE